MKQVHFSPRLWPGVAIAVTQVVVAGVGTLFFSEYGPMGLLAGVGGALLTLIWWLGFSRVPWLERLSGIVVIVVALFALKPLLHISIAGAGQGMFPFILPVPLMTLALVVWAVWARPLNVGARRAALAGAIIVAYLPFVLLRTGGISGGGSEFHWRWTPTPEEILLARGEVLPAPAAPPAPVAAAPKVEEKPVEVAPAATPAATATPRPEPVAPVAVEIPAEWPGFRGANRDSVIRGVRIKTDWAATPPVQMWRRAIGPGWSSFAVRGDLIYTQEQRGAEEFVSCYRLSTGEPVWGHRDPVRFWESNGGPGPRGTPTLHGNRVFSFGATGILNALDAATGKVVWSHDVAAETGRAVPMWGFASSPLVVDNVVIVAAAGTLAGYDMATGARRWTGPSYGGSYSSPHRATFDGVTQVVLLGGPGVLSVAPDTGAVLWQHDWSPGPITQPALTDDGDLLVNAIAATGGLGTRRLHVSRAASGWNVEERWTSNGLKPYFNDFVVHKGHAFGFDGNILSSINLADGKRNWKGGRYGNGQMLLLSDQDLLLVISEEGELALVNATTDQFKEVARFAALDGKTWNHPVLVHDVLLVRNGAEMAAFRISIDGASPRTDGSSAER